MGGTISGSRKRSMTARLPGNSRALNESLGPHLREKDGICRLISGCILVDAGSGAGEQSYWSAAYACRKRDTAAARRIYGRNANVHDRAECISTTLSPRRIGYRMATGFRAST